MRRKMRSPVFDALEPRLLLSAEYYISPAGSDLNPGTLAQPFATLEKAQAKIRDLKNSIGTVPGCPEDTATDFTEWLKREMKFLIPQKPLLAIPRVVCSEYLFRVNWNYFFVN